MDTHSHSPDKRESGTLGQEEKDNLSKTSNDEFEKLLSSDPFVEFARLRKELQEQLNGDKEVISSESPSPQPSPHLSPQQNLLNTLQSEDHENVSQTIEAHGQEKGPKNDLSLSLAPRENSMSGENTALYKSEEGAKPQHKEASDSKPEETKKTLSRVEQLAHDALFTELFGRSKKKAPPQDDPESSGIGEQASNTDSAGSIANIAEEKDEVETAVETLAEPTETNDLDEKAPTALEIGMSNETPSAKSEEQKHHANLSSDEPTKDAHDAALEKSIDNLLSLDTKSLGIDEALPQPKDDRNDTSHGSTFSTKTEPDSDHVEDAGDGKLEIKKDEAFHLGATLNVGLYKDKPTPTITQGPDHAKGWTTHIGKYDFTEQRKPMDRPEASTEKAHPKLDLNPEKRKSSTPKSGWDIHNTSTDIKEPKLSFSGRNEPDIDESNFAESLISSLGIHPKPAGHELRQSGMNREIDPHVAKRDVSSDVVKAPPIIPLSTTHSKNTQQGIFKGFDQAHSRYDNPIVKEEPLVRPIEGSTRQSKAQSDEVFDTPELPEWMNKNQASNLRTQEIDRPISSSNAKGQQQTSNTAVFMLMAFVIIIVVAGGGYFYFSKLGLSTGGEPKILEASDEAIREYSEPEVQNNAQIDNSPLDQGSVNQQEIAANTNVVDTTEKPVEEITENSQQDVASTDLTNVTDEPSTPEESDIRVQSVRTWTVTADGQVIESVQPNSRLNNAAISPTPNQGNTSPTADTQVASRETIPPLNSNDQTTTGEVIQQNNGQNTPTETAVRTNANVSTSSPPTTDPIVIPNGTAADDATTGLNAVANNTGLDVLPQRRDISFDNTDRVTLGSPAPTENTIDEVATAQPTPAPQPLQRVEPATPPNNQQNSDEQVTERLIFDPNDWSNGPLRLNPFTGNQTAPTQTNPQPTTVRVAAAPVTTPQPQIQAPAPATNPNGGFLVQVSSQRSEADAVRSFNTLVSRSPALTGYSPYVYSIDIPDRGTFYRVNAGPFDSRQEAIRLCEAIKTEGGSCIITQR